MLGKMMNTFTTIVSSFTDLCFVFPCDNFASKSFVEQLRTLLNDYVLVMSRACIRVNPHSIGA